MEIKKSNKSIFTVLSRESVLPLTCSRKGTCCHGNLVRINPWELAKMADGKGILVSDFQEKYTDKSGTVLLFNGKLDHRNLASCSQYNIGACTIHEFRPLACRLFPIGRKIQNGESEYFFEGEKFPCLNGCGEVESLPKISVGKYLEQQKTSDFELAQDSYLDMLQNIADIAFELLLDTELAISKEFKTLKKWEMLSGLTAAQLRDFVGETWWQFLILPPISIHEFDTQKFIEKHQDFLFREIEKHFSSLKHVREIYNASCILIGISFLIAHSIGANTKELSSLWTDVALQNGASM